MFKTRIWNIPLFAPGLFDLSIRIKSNKPIQTNKYTINTQKSGITNTPKSNTLLQNTLKSNTPGSNTPIGQHKIQQYPIGQYRIQQNTIYQHRINQHPIDQHPIDILVKTHYTGFVSRFNDYEAIITTNIFDNNGNVYVFAINLCSQHKFVTKYAWLLKMNIGYKYPVYFRYKGATKIDIRLYGICDYISPDNTFGFIKHPFFTNNLYFRLQDVDTYKNAKIVVGNWMVFKVNKIIDSTGLIQYWAKKIILHH